MSTKEQLYTLITGCILFGEDQGSNYQAEIVDLEGVSIHASYDDAGVAGEAYLENHGDSYMILEDYENIKWGPRLKKEFSKMLAEAIQKFENSKTKQP